MSREGREAQGRIRRYFGGLFWVISAGSLEDYEVGGGGGHKIKDCSERLVNLRGIDGRLIENQGVASTLLTDRLFTHFSSRSKIRRYFGGLFWVKKSWPQT